MHKLDDKKYYFDNELLNYRPNSYVLRSLIVVDGIILFATILNLMDIYDSMSKKNMLMVFGLSILLTGLSEYIMKNKTISKMKISGFLIVGIDFLMTFMLCVVLNVMATLALVLPLLLATQYYDPKISKFAIFGGVFVSLIYPEVAYFMQTFSFAYFEGFIASTLKLNIEVVGYTSATDIQNLQNIFLYLTLPQTLIVLVFALILYSVSKNGAQVIKQQSEIIRLNTTDNLTGVYSKGYFYTSCRQLLNLNSLERYLILCTDIHSFKAYNERFGHNAGDKMLISLVQMLSEVSGSLNYCGRLGADNFGLIIKKSEFDEKALKKLINQFNENNHVSLFVGIYEIVDPNIPIESICDRATLAAKEHQMYKHNVVHYSVKMLERLEEQRQMIDKLQLALKENRFVPYLQPQFDRNNELVGAEVLVRMISDDKIYTPNYFIPLCEENGMVSDIDKKVWTTTCKLLGKWKKLGIENLKLSINVSVMDVYQLDVYKSLCDLVKRNKLDANMINIEFTESVMVKNIDTLSLLIEKLRDFGFKIEIDDFGSGYSSLAVLRKIKADTIKLDSDFVKECFQSEKSRQITENVINMSKTIGMDIVAEGIESEEHLKGLKEMGCNYFQGYMLGKPVPIDVFEKTYLDIAK